MKNAIISLKLIIVLVIILIPTSVFAGTFTSNWSRVNNNDLGFAVDVHNNCKKVSNTTGFDYFVPTKTVGEWNAFLTATSSISNLSATDVCLCGPGIYNPGSGCVNAGAGWYSTALSDDRYQCDAGRYGLSNTNSASSCGGACWGGYYCPLGSIFPYQVQCPANSSSPGGSDNIDDCDGNCGYWDCADGTCDPAGAGYYSLNDNETRSSCVANSYGASIDNCTSTCDGACPTNSTSPAGSDNINDCDGNCGYYSCADGTCDPAGAGYWSPNDNDSRYSCNANYYGASTDNCTNTCDGACPTNSTSPSGSDNINDCDGNGGYWDCADGTCNPAGAGWYSANDNDSRYLCSANYYGWRTTNSTPSCDEACPVHSTSPGGSDSINDCDGDAGYYECYDGTCNPAGAGYYSPSNYDFRAPCYAGYYGTSTTNSSGICQGQCSGGTYSNAGATSCTQCPAGDYCFAGGRNDCDDLSPSDPPQWSLAGSDWNSDCFDIDDTPNYFNFYDKSSAGACYGYQTNIVTVTGINAPTIVGVAWNGEEYGIKCGTDGWVYGNNCDVENNDTLQILLVTECSSGWGSERATITVGTFSDYVWVYE